MVHRGTVLLFPILALALVATAEARRGGSSGGSRGGSSGGSRGGSSGGSRSGGSSKTGGSSSSSSGSKYRPSTYYPTTHNYGNTNRNNWGGGGRTSYHSTTTTTPAPWTMSPETQKSYKELLERTKTGPIYSPETQRKNMDKYWAHSRKSLTNCETTASGATICTQR